MVKFKIYDKKLNENNFILYILFLIIWIAYLYDMRIGLIVSIVAGLIGWKLKDTDNYSFSTIIKLYMIIITSIIIFLTKLDIITPYIFNNFITDLIRLNILCLILSIKDNLLLKLGILFSTITTPKFIYTKNMIQKKSQYIDSTLWFILTTIILSYYYYINKDFYDNPCIYLVYFALFFPFITQIINNKWLEPRALFLCLIMIIDLFN
jgi:hypothetical protein